MTYIEKALKMLWLVHREKNPILCLNFLLKEQKYHTGFLPDHLSSNSLDLQSYLLLFPNLSYSNSDRNYLLILFQS